MTLSSATMRIDEPWLWLAGLAGAGLGALFFGGLWWTLQRMLASNRSPLWHTAGSLLRMVVTLAGFYAVGGGQWQRLLACLAGFVIARAVAVRMSQRWGCAAATDAREPAHAPQP